MMRVTLKLQPRETGLAAVSAGPRGYDVRVNGEEVGSVSPIGGQMGSTVRGWYFVVRHDTLGIPLRNTHGDGGVSLAVAKAGALLYVRRCLRGESSQPSSTERENG